MSIDIVWETPPDNEGALADGKFAPVLRQLVDRPGEWARIRIYQKPSTSHVAANRLRAKAKALTEIEEGEFEIIGRTILVEGNKVGGLYARYVRNGAEETE